AFLKLIDVPAAGNDQPRSWLHGPCCITDASERFSQRPCADPIHFGAEAERGANRVQVGIDQTWDHRAALQIDGACRWTGQLADIRRAASHKNAAAVDGDRLTRRELAVYG